MGKHIEVWKNLILRKDKRLKNSMQCLKNVTKDKQILEIYQRREFLDNLVHN